MVDRGTLPGRFNSHDLAVATEFHYVTENIDDLNDFLLLQFRIGDYNKLDEILEGFRRNGTSLLAGCCEVLDGIEIRILKLWLSEGASALSSYSREGLFSVNCQAVWNSSRGRGFDL